MTKDEARLQALIQIWGMTTYLCEGIENGKFIEYSDNMNSDIAMGRYSEGEAKKVQMEIYNASELLNKKIVFLRNKLRKQGRYRDN